MKPCEISDLKHEINATEQMMKINPSNNELLDQLHYLYDRLDYLQDFVDYRVYEEHVVSDFTSLLNTSKMQDYYEYSINPLIKKSKMIDRY